MEQLKRALSEAIRRGFTLSLCAVAGNCGGKSEGESDTPFEQSLAGGTGGTVGGETSSAGGAGAAAGGSAGAAAGTGGMLAAGGMNDLEPYPADQIGCYGENFGGGFGLHGQCCVSAKCSPRVDGVCPSSDFARPSGSGSCSCIASPLEEPVMGPYAAHPADTSNPEAACCYLVAAIGCDGRPLLVDGHAVRAPVVGRADWSAQRR